MSVRTHFQALWTWAAQPVARHHEGWVATHLLPVLHPTLVTRCCLTRWRALQAPVSVGMTLACVLSCLVYARVPLSLQIAQKQPVEFDQAINYVNKIKVRQQGCCCRSSRQGGRVTGEGQGWSGLILALVLPVRGGRVGVGSGRGGRG